MKTTLVLLVLVQAGLGRCRLDGSPLPSESSLPPCPMPGTMAHRVGTGQTHRTASHCVSRVCGSCTRFWRSAGGWLSLRSRSCMLYHACNVCLHAPALQTLVQAVPICWCIGSHLLQGRDGPVVRAVLSVPAPVPGTCFVLSLAGLDQSEGQQTGP